MLEQARLQPSRSATGRVAREETGHAVQRGRVLAKDAGGGKGEVVVGIAEERARQRAPMPWCAVQIVILRPRRYHRRLPTEAGINHGRRFGQLGEAGRRRAVDSGESLTTLAVVAPARHGVRVVSARCLMRLLSFRCLLLS